MDKGIVSIDTLHLSVRYPRRDIFDRWYKYAKGLDTRVLRSGILADDFVVRTGGLGYAISLWQHDARIYLTDQTDEIRGEGNGMGILIQLGPKFIIQHFTDIRRVVKDLLSQIGVRGEWPINITRLDLALDLFGVSMHKETLEDWQNNWVGRSKVSHAHFNSKTGRLETINIGSRSSAVYLRIYDKIAQATKEGDIAYWLDVWQNLDLQEVTRIEWEIKPKRGNFSIDLVDFTQFNGFSVRELLIYLLKWGRLAIPGNDQNKSRWLSTPFWVLVEEVSTEWLHGVTWPTSRYGKEFQGISEAYIKQLSGNISGGMARLGGEAPNIVDMLKGMSEFGEGLETLQEKAIKKANLFKKL